MKIYAIFTKELRSYFVSPTFYVVLTTFLALSNYFFYTDLSFYHWMNMGSMKENSNPIGGLFFYYFNDLRFVLMLCIPLITMRLLAEEKKLGTFELIATYPVRDGEILAGKCLSCLAVFILMMAVTFLNFLFLYFGWGFFGLQALLAGYLGIFFLGCSLISCGIFVSSLTENQAAAAMGTLGIFVLFWFLTWNEMMASEAFINVLTRFSLFDRVEYFFKGVINSRDVMFFTLFIFFFLMMTVLSLKTRSIWGKSVVKRSLRPFFRRSTRSPGGLILTGVLVLGIVIFLEIIFFNHNVKVDLTPNKAYSLSDQTINLLKRIGKDIQFTVFYRQGERKEFDEFFGRLSIHTPHIKYKLIDLDRNPGRARLHGITAYGQTLVEWEGRNEIIRYPTEESVFNLVIKSIRRGKLEVYFTGGHGENSPEEEYLSLRDALKTEVYQVGMIDLAGKEAIPAGDSVLIVGGPKMDFSDKELRKVDRYLEEGGKIILMVEPFVHLPKIKAFLEKYHIGLGDGIIVDSESKFMGGDYLAPSIPNFAKSPITNLFTSPAIFPTARPLEIKGGASIFYLAKSSSTSWIRKERTKSERIDFKEGVDQKGPVPVAIIAIVSSEKSNQTGDLGAVACFGDSDFVNNKFIEMLVNKDLFMNTVNWLGMERKLIFIRPPKYEFAHYYLTKKQGQWAFWFLVMIIPATPLTIGLGIFLYRKRRG